MSKKWIICGLAIFLCILNFCHGLNCRAKEKQTYIRSIGYKVDESNGITRRTDSVAECKKLCSSMTSCEFFVYNTFGKTCTIVKVIGQQQKSVHGKDFIATSTDLELYQKICIEKSTKSCPNDLVRTPQKLLVGFARKIFSDVDTVASCIGKCLPKESPVLPERDRKGVLNADEDASFDCISFIYYYNEKSCILNSASASVHPDLFVNAPEEKEGRFDYFDNTCYEGWTEWSRWSSCLPKNDVSQNQGLRFRQRSCNAWNGKCGSSSPSSSLMDDLDHQTENCDLQVTTVNVVTTSQTFTGQQAVTEAAQQIGRVTFLNKRPCKGQHYLYLDCNGYCINFRELGYSNYPDCLRGGAKNTTLLL